MLVILLISIVLFYIIAGFYKSERFIIYYIPVNFIYDIIIANIGVESYFPLIRGTLFFSLILYFIIKMGLPKATNKLLLIVVLLFIVLIISGIGSENQVKSFSEILKTFNILFMFFVGFSFYRRGADILILFKKSSLLLWIMILNVFISNILGLGFSGYNSTNFYTGIYANGWYAPTIITAIFIIMLFVPTKKTELVAHFRRKKTNYILVFTSFVLILIGGRRTAVIIFLITILMFVYYSSSKSKSVLSIFFLSLLMLIASPLYINILESQYENRLELNEEGLREENRFQETELLWSEMLSFNNPIKSLLGENAFVTAGNYGEGALGMRFLHVDLNIVLYSIGFIGLLIYVLFYLNIFLLARRLFKYFNSNNSFLIVINRMVFFSLFFASVALSFSGGFAAITYRSTSFLILGSILGQLYYLKAKNV